MASQQQQQQEEESKTIPLKILVDKQSNKVVFVEATKDFVDTLFSYTKTVENLNSNDVWNSHVCKQMLLHPKNPCESLCMDLFLNIDDNEPSSKFYACGSCYNYKITNYRNLACGKPANEEIKNLDLNARNGAFVRESGPMFLVSDNLKIVSNSFMTSMQMLIESGISNSTQLEEVTHDIGKKEVPVFCSF
ncbi:DUF674 family protein [Trifolium medium]|uniref:DUF674 family protein n=1 Tax=Trifolium medium TaxID=97028 RepID=A0A392NJD7_9FABA|nr:DUF674 family protein [Trifolium medium]